MDELSVLHVIADVPDEVRNWSVARCRMLLTTYEHPSYHTQEQFFISLEIFLIRIYFEGGSPGFLSSYIL